MSTTQDRIKVGLDLPTSDRTGLGWSELRDIAMLAEEVGFDSIWLDDHLLYHMRGAAEPNGNWESWSMRSALAACTRTVELGNLVLGTGFRNPALLAKMADTVDEISGGRLTLGVGTGYHERSRDSVQVGLDVPYKRIGYPPIDRLSPRIQRHDIHPESGIAPRAGRWFGRARRGLYRPRRGEYRPAEHNRRRGGCLRAGSPMGSDASQAPPTSVRPQDF